MYQSKRRRAFTLLEMLVVISIIMLLSSMVLVSFSKFKAKARETQCLNNLKNLHGSIMVESDSWLNDSRINVGGYWDRRSHTDDWDWKIGWVNRGNMTSNDYEVLDRPTAPSSFPGDPAPWFGAAAEQSIIEGQVYKNAMPALRIFVCPEFIKRAEAMGVSDIKRSYVMNGSIHGRRYNSISPRQLGDNPAEAGKGFSTYLMFADMAITNEVAGSNICFRAAFGGPTALDDEEGGDGVLEGTLHGSDAWPWETIGSYHANGMANVVFMDGHAEKLHRSETTNVCVGIR